MSKKMIASVAILLFAIILAPTILNFIAHGRQKTPAHTPERYRLIRHACHFSVPKHLSVSCASLHTPQAGGAFVLPVAVLHFTGAHKSAAPLLYLQGGPGAGARINREGLQDWAAWRDYAGLKRDLILLDRRGTGGAKPRPVCRAYEQFSRSVLTRATTLLQEWQEGSQVLLRCLNTLGRFNPAHYGTRKSAADVRALVAALHLNHWNLLGVSYGTRLAIEVARHAPGLDALILDSVYPPGVGGLLQWPDTLGAAMAMFFQRCGQQPACQKAWQRSQSNTLTPQALQQLMQKVLAQLHRQPMTISAKVNGWPEDIVVTDHRLLAASFAAIYDLNRWPDIIAALAGVTNQQKPPVQKLMQAFVHQALSDSVTSLTFMAVDCRDNPTGSQAAYRQQIKQHPQWARYLKGLWQTQLCRQWLAAKPLTLVPVKIPRIALLAGQLDPITPLKWAQQLAQQWPAARLSIFKQTSHSVLGSRPCALAQLEPYLAGRQQRWHECDKP